MQKILISNEGVDGGRPDWRTNSKVYDRIKWCNECGGFTMLRRDVRAGVSRVECVKCGMSGMWHRDVEECIRDFNERCGR